MNQSPFGTAISIDEQLYHEILDAIKQIFRRFSQNATAMHVVFNDQRYAIGQHVLFSKGDQDAGYFVLYETDLFETLAQIRFLRGEYQIQYTLEPRSVILLSQFRLQDDDVESEEQNCTDSSVITIAQPISHIEAKGLLGTLSTYAQ